MLRQELKERVHSCHLQKPDFRNENFTVKILESTHFMGLGRSLQEFSE